MGDMADYFIDLGIQQKLDADLYYDGSIDGSDECSESYHFKKTIKTCTRCGTNNLHWQNTKYGWRLHNINGEIHNCIRDPKENDNKKSPFGPIQLGRRTVKAIKINENGTMVDDWERVKQITKDNIKDGQYVEITTTEVNGKIMWIVKVKIKKSYIQETISFPPKFPPPFIPSDEPPF